MPEVSGQQRLLLKFTQSIADQHPMDRDRHIPATVTAGGLGADFD